MTEAILTHDAGVSAFEDAGGVVQTTDDDGVTFSWDDDNIVRVDAPANLKGAFDTERFYKIEGATVARPIKQAYLVGDDIEWYKKPADELDKAAWSFDNAPFTLGHPDTGMVKNVDDIRGFWRNPRYDHDSDRLKEDLYVPVGDDGAMEFIEEHGDVSVGFYNRVHSDYDGNTGDLSDDDGLDGFQVDMFGNHIAGVEQGRCSSEHGCGLDSECPWNGNLVNDSAKPNRENADHGQVVAAGPQDTHRTMTDDTDYDISPSFDGDFTTDYRNSEGRYFAVGPDENPDDELKYPINNCEDARDAWNLRTQGNIDISVSDLETRIKSRASELNCQLPHTARQDEAGESNDCGCNTTNDEDDSNMGDTDDNTDGGFDIPDLSVDALVEKNDAVREIKEERDSLREDLDEMRTEIEDALDAAENFSADLDDDESPCEAVDTLVSDLDAKVEEVEDLTEELTEYRQDDIEDRLDRLDELGADREDWEETADEADDPLDTLDAEIQRREEVLDAAPETSVKDIDSSTDTDETSDSDETTMSGARRFGRGHQA